MTSSLSELSGVRIAVAGAGVFGLHVALATLAAGARVEVWDPAPFGDNASGIAAGMIAPVGEMLFDSLSPHHLNLFRVGRDGWLQLERTVPGLTIDRSGSALLFDDKPTRDEALARLRHRKVVCEARDDRSLFTPEDWRVDTQSALGALKAAIIRAGGVFKAHALTPTQNGEFDAVVLAAGSDSHTFSPLAPELTVLSPIKGQIVRLAGPAIKGPALRMVDAYLVPQSYGALVGATMEPGRDDRSVDPSVVARLRDRAIGLMPALEGYSVQGLAGVRAATPDGLPMAGRSSAPGLFIATGARRNGWLLAPLVSQILVSYLSGGDGGPFATAFDPKRFAAL